MEIAFKIGDIPATLSRKAELGNMKISTPGASFWLTRPKMPPHPHQEPRRQQCGQELIAGHQVRVEKVLPLLFSGVRAPCYQVFVDDKLVASANEH